MEEDKIKVVIIGGSAGSLEVLMQVFPKLKPITTFAIVLVLHRKSSEDNTLEELIALKTIIPVAEVEDKVMLQPGYVYIAPANYHLLFETNRTLSMDTSEKVNYSRPSIDVCFESAAATFGAALTGILLSGANSDGTNGLIAIQQAGGATIIQTPQSADMPFMPQTALNAMNPDLILDIDEITKFINSLSLN